MKKFILGLVLGSVVTATALLPLLYYERKLSWDLGTKHGIVVGRFDAADALLNEFGTYDGHSPYKLLLSVKSSDIISIETNGVKTVRINP